jgi:AmiR/NasT family two-component response regulator
VLELLRAERSTIARIPIGTKVADERDRELQLLQESTVADGTAKRLRVLIADGLAERQQLVTRTVTSLGHEVVGEGVSFETIGDATAAELPDVALVIVGDNSDKALDLIRMIVHEATCPVIAILDVQDRAFIDRAARLGIFSYIAHADDLQEMQSSMDVSLQRFAEYHALEGAFGRRAIMERAKGILMERHSIDEQRAFQLLREHARRTNRKMVDVAASVLESHQLLSSGSAPAPADEGIGSRSTEDR